MFGPNVTHKHIQGVPKKVWLVFWAHVEKFRYTLVLVPHVRLLFRNMFKVNHQIIKIICCTGVHALFYIIDWVNWKWQRLLLKLPPSSSSEDLVTIVISTGLYIINILDLLYFINPFPRFPRRNHRKRQAYRDSSSLGTLLQN